MGILVKGKNGKIMQHEGVWDGETKSWVCGDIVDEFDSNSRSLHVLLFESSDGRPRKKPIVWLGKDGATQQIEGINNLDDLFDLMREHQKPRKVAEKDASRVSQKQESSDE